MYLFGYNVVYMDGAYFLQNMKSPLDLISLIVSPLFLRLGWGLLGVGWRLFWVIWLSCFFLFWLAAD